MKTNKQTKTSNNNNNKKEKQVTCSNRPTVYIFPEIAFLVDRQQVRCN